MKSQDRQVHKVYLYFNFGNDWEIEADHNPNVPYGGLPVKNVEATFSGSLVIRFIYKDGSYKRADMPLKGNVFDGKNVVFDKSTKPRKLFRYLKNNASEPRHTSNSGAGN